MPHAGTVAGFVDTYLRLNQAEEERFHREMAGEKWSEKEKEAVVEIVTSWEQRGIEKGLAQGIEKGIEIGRQAGVEALRAALIDVLGGSALWMNPLLCVSPRSIRWIGSRRSPIRR